VEPLFRAIDAGDLRGVTSVLTLLEVLVVPYRSGLLELAERYEAILLSSRNLDVVPLDPPILRAAAQLRAATSMRTPDALQVASALALGCTKLVTNDRRLPAVPGLEVLQLSDFL
jgi:predicted nucleic acid-binding protein